MKLYATIESERGKVIEKSGNDYLRIVLHVQDGTERHNPVGYIELLYKDDVQEFAQSDEEHKPDMNEWTISFRPREDEYTDWNIVHNGHVYPATNERVNRKR